MNKEYRAVLEFIKTSITNKASNLEEDFDFAKVAKIAQKHGIASMVYYGAKGSGFEGDSLSMAVLFKETCISLAVYESQKYVFGELYRIFEENQIDYMPVKGLLLRDFYPKPEMRYMCDTDILIKLEQYPKIRELLSNAGFTEVAESNHELIWKKSNVSIELHKLLIPSYNKDYYSYYGDGWKLGTIRNGSRISMTDEDCFIYVFTHFAKHYRDMGIGLRNMVDIWIFDKNVSLDYDYLKNELTSLQLYDFYVNVMNTLKYWFEDGESNDITEFITDYIFKSGMYGTLDNHIISMSLKDTKGNQSIFKIRFKKIMRSIFPTVKDMYTLFPILNKVSFLLPVMWFYFTVKRIFTKGKFKKFKHDVQMIDSQKIDKYQEALNFVGLDFNFKE